MRPAVGTALQAGARLERPVELDAQSGRHGRRPWLEQAEMLHPAALQRLVEAAAGPELRRHPERLRHLGHHALAVGGLAQHELDELATRRKQRQPVSIRSRRDPAGIGRQVGMQHLPPFRAGRIDPDELVLPGLGEDQSLAHRPQGRPARRDRRQAWLDVPLSRSMRQMLPEALRSRRSRCQSAAIGRRAVRDIEFSACRGHRGDASRLRRGPIAAAVEAAALDDDLAGDERDGQAVVTDRGDAGDLRTVIAAPAPRAVRSRQWIAVAGGRERASP